MLATRQLPQWFGSCYLFRLLDLQLMFAGEPVEHQGDDGAGHAQVFNAELFAGNRRSSGLIMHGTMSSEAMDPGELARGIIRIECDTLS